MSLATAIKQLRKEQGMTPQDLAMHTGFTVSYICFLENPHEPTAHTINRLAEAFGITRLELLTKADE